MPSSWKLNTERYSFLKFYIFKIMWIKWRSFNCFHQFGFEVLLLCECLILYSSQETTKKLHILIFDFHWIGKIVFSVNRFHSICNSRCKDFTLPVGKLQPEHFSKRRRICRNSSWGIIISSCILGQWSFSSQWNTKPSIFTRIWFDWNNHGHL